MTNTSLNAPSPTPVVASAAATDYALQRLNMVDSQVRPSDVTDRRVLRAMGQVPREAFVPAELKSIAYMDIPVALDRERQPRAMIEPRLFAKLVQLAEIQDGGRVLEIGCGSGYGVAVLAAMGCKAFGLEENTSLFTQAQALTASAGVVAGTIKLSNGPLALGWPSEGPFDAIIFSGSVPVVPAGLFDQLKNGGRLVAVRGNGPGSKATAWLRSGMSFSQREAFDATAFPLPGFAPAPTFVF